MTNRFDELAKVLAGSMSRRTALWRVGGIVGGVAMSFFGLEKKAFAANCQAVCLGVPVLLRPLCLQRCACGNLGRIFCGRICCPAGRGCANGVCINPPCTSDAQCPMGMVCAGGACITNRCIGVNCDDGNACTTDTCLPASGCMHTPVAAGTACPGGQCNGTGTCVPAGFCSGRPNGTPCDDGNACTQNDTCQNGACVGTPVNCDDGNPCTTDSCNPATGCVHTPRTGTCNDGNNCTFNDACQNGVCVGMPSPVNSVCAPGRVCDGMGTCLPAGGM